MLDQAAHGVRYLSLGHGDSAGLPVSCDGQVVLEAVRTRTSRGVATGEVIEVELIHLLAQGASLLPSELGCVERGARRQPGKAALLVTSSLTSA